MKALVASTFMLLTSACASTSPNAAYEIADPWENMNRSIYAFNKGVDKTLYKPVAGAYRAVVPKIPRKGVSNAMRNLREPWTFVNDILQLKFKRAGTTLSRFVVNTAFGVGGLFDVSKQMDIPFHSEDLGQTFASWGLGNGPYFIIPFVGPASTSDAIGFAAFVIADPVTLGISRTNVRGLNLTRTGVEALDLRALNHKVLNSLYDDPEGYELMRSSYRQSRRFELYDGNPPEEDGDIFDDLEDEDEDAVDDEPVGN